MYLYGLPLFNFFSHVRFEYKLVSRLLLLIPLWSAKEGKYYGNLWRKFNNSFTNNAILAMPWKQKIWWYIENKQHLGALVWSSNCLRRSLWLSLSFSRLSVSFSRFLPNIMLWLLLLSIWFSSSFRISLVISSLSFTRICIILPWENVNC